MLYEHVENNFMVGKLEYGLENLEKQSSRETTLRRTDNDDNETRPLRKTTTIDGKLKKPVVKLAPMFFASVFRHEARACNVGASHQQAKKVDFECVD